MNFFKKLFGKQNNKAEGGSLISITPEPFFNSDDIKGLLEKYKRAATVLKPCKSLAAIDPNASKFGGIPNGAGFDVYPCCDACDTPLHFVLQLYKKDFPHW